MIDFSLTKEQKAFQKTARDFTIREIKPFAAKLDRVEDPEREVYWSIVKKGAQNGFSKVMIPQDIGGLGRGVMDWSIIMEELAVGDVGVAGGLILLESPVLMLLEGGTETQCEKWLKEIYSKDIYPLAIAATEPDAGGTDLSCPIPDPKLGMEAFAEKKGDAYVINGHKGPWIMNGSAAEAYYVLARTDKSKPPMDSTSLFWIPADTPGLSRNETDKIGWRSLPVGELYLDDVKISSDNLIGKEGDGLGAFHGAFQYGIIAIASLYVGLARAAFECAVDYAKIRQTWGQPIINHQAVAIELADMKIDVEAARLLTWNAAWALDSQPDIPTTKGALAEVFNTEAAVRVAQKAMNILGGNGYTKEYPVEKILRDALLGPIGDMPNTLWRLGIATAL